MTNFIKKANEIHNNKYDYSKVEYVNTQTPVCIICPEHGEFWQTPHNHIGQKQGCPICSSSHGENEIANFLFQNGIQYEREKTFEWLKYRRNLYLDFYLPQYNVAIEVQGEQHFMPIKQFGGEKELKYIKDRDKKKYNLCKGHNIVLLYYSNNIIENNIFNDKNKLLEEIYKYD